MTTIKITQKFLSASVTGAAVTVNNA